MDVNKAIETRRAYRSFAPVEISDELVKSLSEAAQLAPSCFNNQPWRYVFVREAEPLTQVNQALSAGNAWARDASLIIAVMSRPEDDCVIKDRVYHQFDTGMATAFMMLRATELGLVMHPIAGFDPLQVKAALNLPEGYQVICLLMVGVHDEVIRPSLSDGQKASEPVRPVRRPLEQNFALDSFNPQLQVANVR